MMESETVDLEKLIFEPDEFDSVSTDDRIEVYLEDFDLDFDDPEPADWTQSQNEFFCLLADAANEYGLGDSIVTDEGALRMAVLMHSILVGVYGGQEINVRSLIQFQEASSTQFAFSRLMDLVPILSSNEEDTQKAAGGPLLLEGDEDFRLNKH